MLIWLIAFAIGTTKADCVPNDPAACLRWLTARADGTMAADLADSAMVGQWTEGEGLSGSELYLFPDHTFVHTQWTDLFPEVVYDK